MSLVTPKPPRRFRGKSARHTGLRDRLDKARRTRFDGPFLVQQAALQINRAASANEVIQATASALALAPDPCFVFQVSPDGLSLEIPRGKSFAQISIQQIESLITEDQESAIIETDWLDSPFQPLQDTLIENGCKSAIALPIRKGGAIASLILVGLGADRGPTLPSLRIYSTIAEIAETGLDKTLAIQSAQRPLAELEAFNFISQAVAGQTDLEELYPIIHKAIGQILGEVDLIIALYDSSRQIIQVPYLYEHPNLLSIDPFPLGQGLTSVLIRTRQSLLLSRDVEIQAREMGAIVLGQAPKSWLGVPMLVADEPIGALVVQDLEQEFRFSEDDQRLLTSLGAQIAVSIYNAQLIDQSRRMARRERLLHEVTSKIRSSTDMKTILATTATELGRALHLQSATIEVGIKQNSSSNAGLKKSNGDKPPQEQSEPGEERPAP
ncbi:MAG: GAF domain-containing protein [Anaerolineales bacterium]|jgi:GAF domain-containing protein